MHTLSQSKQQHILSLLDAGHTASHIASTTGYSLSTISRLHTKHHSHLSKSIGGHPVKLSPANLCHATHLISSRKAETATAIAKSLSTIISQPLSAQTVRNHLKKVGMKAVVKQKRPFLSKKHQKARLDFAIAHQYWTVDDWKRVIWSDETKINRLGSDGRKWAWKRSGENLSERLVEGTLKYGGGSVMIWGCMTWEGVGYATKIDGRMDGDLYISILDDELQATMDFYDVTADNIIFQQDNDPKHTCKKAKKWFQDHDMQVLIWPAQSPDLNPIEHLWSHLKRKLGEYEEPARGINELWERVQVVWDKIPAEECQKLIESMPRRVEAVLRAKGGYTKY
jgi:hypothetical protein